jgi:RNA polymerase sigma factor (sigma-70 family)
MGEANQELIELVKQAKQGDSASCNELVNRYRKAAISWAREIVHDEHLAEDVAQEAFLKMIAKLHQLHEEQKFTPWFRLLVRRLSMNCIRNAQHNRERTVDAVPETVSRTFDPERSQRQKENEDEIRDSLDKLPKRSRDILISSALLDATPDELAVRFEMKKANVYNILSRARSKMNDERFEKEISHYLKERRSQNKSVSVTLEPPVISRPYAFLSVMIGEILHLIDKHSYSQTELMGISGEAFRLNVPPNCHWKDIATFDWSYTAYRALEQLGISGSCCGRPQIKSITPEQQLRFLTFIQQSVDRGIPAIVRNMQLNEFGFIYGYNDETRELLYCGYSRNPSVCRYERLGRTEEDLPLFVLSLHGKTSPPLNDAGVLRSIVQHAKSKEPPLAGFAFGLEGYRLWLEAIERGTLDLSGHAYQIAIMSEARQQASDYLHLLSKRYPSASKQLQAAAECYREVADVFSRLYPRFPFGYGGSHGNRLSLIYDELSAAREAEAKGISLLERCDLR